MLLLSAFSPNFMVYFTLAELPAVCCGYRPRPEILHAKPGSNLLSVS
jgi:hypothetical protein